MKNEHNDNFLSSVYDALENSDLPNKFLEVLMPTLKKLGEPTDKAVAVLVAMSLFKIGIGILSFNEAPEGVRMELFNVVNKLTEGALSRMNNDGPQPTGEGWTDNIKLN